MFLMMVKSLFCFRNKNHEIWFYFSIVCFVVSLIFFVTSKNVSLILFLESFHVGTSVAAVFKVKIKKEQSELYSVDCIWFNALMAGLYEGLIYYYGI